MVWRRKKRYRKPRRSRWRGRRKHLYWRRRHHWPYRRRRRYHRHRTATVRYYPSRRRKRISVRGWEPLGNICPGDAASAEATPYKDLDEYEIDIENTDQSSSNKYGQWHGQWGHHFFTVRSLLLRAKYYFNYWSSDWEGYDYIQFRGGRIWLPRMPGFSWIFYLDPSIQSNPKESDPEPKYKYDTSWVHPGILLNRPGSRLMISTFQQPYKSFFRSLLVKPPSGWEGVYRIDQAMDYLLFHWSWSTCNLTSSFYDFYCQRRRQARENDPRKADKCTQRPWFMGEKDQWSQMGKFITDGYAKMCKDTLNIIRMNKQDTRAVWVNRKKYIKSDCIDTAAKDNAPSNFHNWGPFLPQNVLTDYVSGNSVYFRYKLWFKVSGDSLYRRLPSQPCKDAVIPPAPGTSENPCGKIPTRSILKRRTPPTIYDILPGDLDEGGLLTDRAYRRITGSSGPDQPTAMVTVPHRRVPSRKRVRIREPIGVCKRKRARQLIRHKRGGGEEDGGGGPPPDPPPVTEPLDLLLNFPK
uniref:Capsid protein n=1 Tax=Torque teno Leptonychotes weddellii virus-1 TaxID=2012676 RepID=A0A1Z2RWR5_9VIRU|nr:ORF1 [Torque teno Leptonychotes weddellii virus 1]